MEQSPSWEANSFLCSQEIPCILLGSLPYSQQPAICPSWSSNEQYERYRMLVTARTIPFDS
jgi:hypothetical protein